MPLSDPAATKMIRGLGASPANFYRLELQTPSSPSSPQAPQPTRNTEYISLPHTHPTLPSSFSVTRACGILPVATRPPGSCIQIGSQRDLKFSPHRPGLIICPDGALGSPNSTSRTPEHLDCSATTKINGDNGDTP